MCGIIAVLRRPSSRPVPDLDSLLGRVDRLTATLDEVAGALAAGQAGLAPRLAATASDLAEVDRSLRGTAGVAALLARPGGLADAGARLDALAAGVRGLEDLLDAGRVPLPAAAIEEVNAALVALKDAAWALREDRLRTGRAVGELLAGDPDCETPTMAALDAFSSVQAALSALDRLEVRGRDSAGLHLLVADHGLDLSAPEVRTLMGARAADPLFTSLAVRTPAGHLSLVYKAAAEIGELGDNTRALRAAIRADQLLHRALRQPDARCAVLGHTRWASVGVISQANAHPLNSDEVERPDGPYVTAALNGDVDNYLELRAAESLRVPAEVTTDAKVIPTLVSRRVALGDRLDDAVRTTVARFEGSVAIGLSSAEDPDRLHFALRGSGQALYVGLADDAFVVASEPYGLVEETPCYLRLEGEGGQMVVLDRRGAGTIGGIARYGYDGTAQPVDQAEIVTAEITTRDIDRAGFPHFLLKEISEAPRSFRKTLRGRITERQGRLEVALGDDVIPASVRRRLASGELRRVLVIGQGTAAVAGQSVAAAIATCTGTSPLAVSALPATELSGFALEDDMSDCLIVAISQSGTTTDTNRTVDLVRGRGAAVIAVVNRRNSDLVDRSDGVLYTSDGRDVEMSVASTKAFYAQVAAGFLLAAAIAGHVGCADAAATSTLLQALRALPGHMETVLATRESIAAAAGRLAPSRRYWAVVGNGPNRVAAAEVRIKLSELCYKSIACDATEDKKHIDLSSEPLILVCAAGLADATAGDVGKEIAIYRAHKAAPVVIADEGTAGRFPAALDVLEVPAVDPALSFVLSAMVGHLFGYEAALAIDAQARPLREARAAVERIAGAGDPDAWLARLGPALTEATAPFFEGLRAGAYNGHLEAGTAVGLVSLLRYATGMLPVEAYELEFGKVGTPGAIAEDLVAALTAGIDELTRPVDAIKHQAKTVTVGISRSEEALLGAPLVRAVLEAGASQDLLSYRALRTLAGLQPAVEEIVGFTRYRIEGDLAGEATAVVVDRGGVGASLRSRTEGNPVLRGTKHRAAEEREVTVAKGRSDGRTVVLVPEIKANSVTGMTLLHVRFADRLPASAARAVLAAYRNRYAALADAVTETEPTFDDAGLAEVPMVDLLTEPVYVLAERWGRMAS